MKSIKAFLRSLLDSLRDLLPIILVIGFFQLVVLQQPIPNFGEIAVGVLFVVIGLTLFVHGLNLGLFPIGETMAYSFASKGSLVWLLLFAFSLGFGTTVAEPALIAVADEAAVVAASGQMIEDTEQSRESYAFGLRMTVAISVGFAIVLGVFRIIKGWPIQYLIIWRLHRRGDNDGVCTQRDYRHRLRFGRSHHVDDYGTVWLPRSGSGWPAPLRDATR